MAESVHALCDPRACRRSVSSRDCQSWIARPFRRRCPCPSRGGRPGRVDVQVRDRIVAETHGNPLACWNCQRYERCRTGGWLPGSPARGIFPVSFEKHFLRRVEALPGGHPRLMLVAAADPTGDAALLMACGADARDRARRRWRRPRHSSRSGSRVQFRHPLIRSAIYSGSSTEDRRPVHLALAAAMDPETDPDRRVWHRALAAAGHDEEVASELERSASRAQSRGGLAAAGAFSSGRSR